jgi:crossover junction endodeoxyribonuclease RuvC
VMRILGIDPGTRTVGYGLLDPVPRRVDGLPFQYVECGVIEAPRTADLAARLQVVAQTLEEIIDEFRPDALAIEKAFTGRNAASALKLGQARGAIMLVATRKELPVFEYAPARVKRVAVGHGRATKRQIQQRMQLLFRLRRAPLADAADALAIALCHGQCVGQGAR